MTRFFACTFALALAPTLLLGSGCSSKESKGAPPAASSIVVTVRPPASERPTGPSFLDDRPPPSAAPLPVASTPSGPPKASCDMRTRRATCFDFYRPRPTDKSDCENTLAGGKYGTTPCPTERTIGYCTTAEGDRRHYYDTPAPEGFGKGEVDAKLNCETRRFTPAGAPPPPAPSAAASASAPK